MPYDADVTIVGIRDVLRRFALLSHGVESSDILNEIGLFLVTRIQARTAQGKDVDGDKFTEYSPEYRLFRERTGHSGTKVNLFYTGSMMSSMTFELYGNDGVRLFFQNTSDPSGTRNPDKAFWHNEGADPQPERRFFAVSEEDRLRAVNIIERRIRQLNRRRR